MSEKQNKIHAFDWDDHRGARNSQYETIQKKIIKKHGVHPKEVEDAFIRSENPVLYKSLGRADDPEITGERGLYMGKIEHGRYLQMIAIAKPTGEGILLSAREMDENDKRHYWDHFDKRSLM